jgi:hypothetical protein
MKKIIVVVLVITGLFGYNKNQYNETLYDSVSDYMTVVSAKMRNLMMQRVNMIINHSSE